MSDVPSSKSLDRRYRVERLLHRDVDGVSISALPLNGIIPPERAQSIPLAVQTHSHSHVQPLTPVSVPPTPPAPHTPSLTENDDSLTRPVLRNWRAARGADAVNDLAALASRYVSGRGGPNADAFKQRSAAKPPTSADDLDLPKTQTTAPSGSLGYRIRTMVTSTLPNVVARAITNKRMAAPLRPSTDTAAMDNGEAADDIVAEAPSHGAAGDDETATAESSAVQTPSTLRISLNDDETKDRDVGVAIIEEKPRPPPPPPLLISPRLSRGSFRKPTIQHVTPAPVPAVDHDVAAITAAVAALRGEVQSVVSSVSTLEQTLLELETRVSAIDVGAIRIAVDDVTSRVKSLTSADVPPRLERLEKAIEKTRGHLETIFDALKKSSASAGRNGHSSENSVSGGSYDTLMEILTYFTIGIVTVTAPLLSLWSTLDAAFKALCYRRTSDDAMSIVTAPSVMDPRLTTSTPSPSMVADVLPSSLPSSANTERRHRRHHISAHDISAAKSTLTNRAKRHDDKKTPMQTR